MFRLVYLLVLPVLGLANSDAFVTIGLPLGKSNNLEAQNQAASKFWTSERFLSAKAIDIEPPKNLSSGPAARAANSPPIQIPGVKPSTTSPTSKSGSYRGRHLLTTGRVFWYIGSYVYSCSGVVVPSLTGDLVITSGYCVFNTATLSWYINNNWVFVPGYFNGGAPFGVWTPRRMWVSTQYATRNPNYNYDVGFVALNTLYGNHIQNVVGSQGIGFNWGQQQLTYSFAYPENLFNGLWLVYCAGYAQKPNPSLLGYNGQGIFCTMGAGSAGGPRLQSFVESTGIGYVTSINSFTYSYSPYIIYGPYFDSTLYSIYNAVRAI